MLRPVTKEWFMIYKSFTHPHVRIINFLHEILKKNLSKMFTLLISIQSESPF